MAIFWTLITILNLANAALFLAMVYRYSFLYIRKRSRPIANLLVFSTFITINSLMWVFLVLIYFAKNFGTAVSIPLFSVSAVEFMGYFFLWKVSIY